jgi:predicted permease
MLAAAWIRLRALVFRHRADSDLDEEIRYHLERDIERNIAHGMTPAHARDAARRAFGNPTVATEQARDAMRWAWLEELRQDARFTLRTCRRTPTFALTVIATIGLGLGLLTTAFTVFNAYVLRPLAVRDPDRLFEVYTTAEDRSTRMFSWRRFEALHAERNLVEDALVYRFHQTRIRGAVALGQLVSGNYFDMLRVPPALGRTLVPSDATPPTGEDMIVLSHQMWQSTFGGDSSIIGQRIALRGVPMTIVGVTREGFGGLGSVPQDFWVPITSAARLGEPDPFALRPADGLRVVVRIRAASSVEQSTRSLAEWFRQHTVDHAKGDRITGVFLDPRGTSLPNSDDVFFLFAPILTGFVLVLLVACANVANMMLARGFARQREIGIRLALGAGRGRLIRQLLTEALLLSVPAGILGFVVSRAVIDICIRVMFATVPAAYATYLRAVPFNADARLVAFMFATAACAAVAFGLVPALQATRPDIVRASRGDFDTEHRPSRLRNALVVVQVAMSVILLITAGVLLGNARDTKRLDPGIQTSGVLQLQVAERARVAVVDQLRHHPAVDTVATARWAPLDGGWWVINLRNASGVSEATNINIVSPEYFGAVRLPMLGGRSFTADEALGRVPVVIVSEAAARRFWPDRDPIGETLELSVPRTDTALFGAFRAARVIGVVRDATPGVITRPKSWPAVYYPLSPAVAGAVVLARTRGNAELSSASIVATISGDDSTAIDEAHSLSASIALQTYPFRVAYWLATAVGCIALLLTISGIYGVVSYLVGQRRKEFGIRMALGAAASSIVALVLRQSLASCAIGVAIGLFVALALSKVLAGALFVTNAFDAGGYVVGTVAVIFACFAATYIPSRNAAAIDPASALRTDS